MATSMRSVANRVNFVDDLPGWVTGPQEIAVHGVNPTVFRDGSQGRIERLGENLPSKYPGRLLRAAADKQVLVDGFYFQVIEQFLQIGGQGISPVELLVRQLARGDIVSAQL